MSINKSSNATTLTLDALRFLCSVINQTVDLPNTVISDTSIATNTTYSSYLQDKKFISIEEECKKYTDELVAGMNKLTKEVIDDKSLVTKDNVLYLYKAPDDISNNYMQIMLINGAPVEMGSTEVDFDNYYNKSYIDSKVALKIDLETLTSSFNNLKTEIGTDTLTTTSQTLKGGINEIKKDLTTHTSDTDIHITTAERTKWNNVDNKIDKTSISTTIDITSTNEQVPSALAVKTELDNKLDKTYTPIIPSVEPVEKVVGSIWIV